LRRVCVLVVDFQRDKKTATLQLMNTFRLHARSIQQSDW
jgi:hypothetical protein